MPNAWPLVQLGELLTKSDDWFSIRPDEKYRQVTVKLWGQGVVLRNEVTGAEIAASQRLRVRTQQFILSRIDARNGALGLVPDSLDGGVVSSDFPVFTPNHSRILSRFLNWMSKTAGFVDLCKAASEGTTNRVRLKEDKFLAFKIPLPPLNEQQRIVARIEALAAKIEEAHAVRDQASTEADALLLSALTDLRLRNGANVRRIADCATMSTGTTPPSGRSDYYGGPIQWYTPGDLEHQQSLGPSSRTLSQRALTERKARMFEPGTVLLVAIGGSLGKVGLTHERCSANQQITGIRFSGDVVPEYGFWWMRGLGRELMAAAPQATLPIINQDRIGAFEISVPPVREQRRIVAYLDNLQAKVDALKKLQAETAAELDALLPSILDREFSGEL